MARTRLWVCASVWVTLSCGGSASDIGSSGRVHPQGASSGGDSDGGDADGVGDGVTNGVGSGKSDDVDGGAGDQEPTPADDEDVDDDVDPDDDVPDAIPVDLDGEPLYYRYIRLSHTQWENSVRDNLRLNAPTALDRALAPDARFTRYSNNENVLGPSPQLVSDYQHAGEQLAASLRDDADLLASVYAGTDPAGFVSEVGQRFYRRPLTAEEQTRYVNLFAEGEVLAAGDGFPAGATLVLQALLQSPNFLYRIETAAPGEPLDGYELATKLAYFLTDSTPSDDLLATAARGELDTDDGFAASVTQLLESDRARLVMRAFHGETHYLQRIESIVRPEDSGYDSALNAELQESAYLFFDRIFTSDLGVSAILTSTVGYVSKDLANLYGVPAPDAEGLQLYDFGPTRTGYFSQVPHLMIHAYGTTPDSIGRGGAIARDVLCAEVPPEPALDQAPTLPDPSLTNRERVTQQTGALQCAGCHSYLDPLGFAFENFDALGMERTMDNGRPVDTVGRYPFTEGVKDFRDAAELMQLIASGDQAHRCYAKHLAEYALTREVSLDDEPLIDSLTFASLISRESLESLVRTIVTSPTFRTRRGE